MSLKSLAHLSCLGDVCLSKHTRFLYYVERNYKELDIMRQNCAWHREKKLFLKPILSKWPE